VPIFRVCSSGISQLVDANGRIRASAPFPGQGAVIGGVLNLAKPGRLPVDYYLGPAASGLTAGIGAILLILAVTHKSPRATVQATTDTLS
jgi:apolipoprotein N-acyltransferase